MAIIHLIKSLYFICKWLQTLITSVYELRTCIFSPAVVFKVSKCSHVQLVYKLGHHKLR